MKLLSRKLIIFPLAIVLSAGLITSASAAPIEVPERYLIVFPSNASANSAANSGAVNAAGGRVLRTLANIDTVVISIPRRAAERIAAARPDWVVGPDLTVSLFETQNQILNPDNRNWGLDRIDAVSLNLNRAYSYPAAEQGQGVTAYVFDTGIRRDHVEFGGRAIQGFQGYPDTPVTGTGDCEGHGTHVAGTIGGNTVGIAKKVNLVAVTVLDCGGSGSTSVISAGADWAIAHHVSGPAVANMSLGGGANSVLDAVVSKMVADGITVVVAAGNSNADACNSSPARAASAITVGASAITDARSSFSNFGSCVDLFAPGSGIYSAVNSGSSSYASWNGTSMASPAVAGVVARYLTVNPTATPATVWTELNKTLTLNQVTLPGTGSPNKLLFASPAGYATVSPEATAPLQVSGLNASSPTANSISLSWQAPLTGGSPITSYDIEVSTSSEFTAPVSSSVGVTNSATVSSLLANTPYFVRVAARNAVGRGAWSQVAEVRTLVGAVAPSAPLAPAPFSAVTRSKSSIALSWTAPAGTVTSYVLEVSTSSNFATILRATSLSAVTRTTTVSSLRSRTQYHFRIAAVNSTGRGLWAVSSAITSR